MANRNPPLRDYAPSHYHRKSYGAVEPDDRLDTQTDLERTGAPGESDNSSIKATQGPGERLDEDAAAVVEVPQGRQIGVTSAAFLIVNRVVGTGVFATTSTILAQSGSVGMSLLYWVIGAVIAAAGLAVYSEFATAIPRNGGELCYIQHVWGRRPKYLATVMYAAQAMLLGQAAGNAYTAGSYLIRAGGGESEWGARGIGVAILLSAITVHGTMLKWGLRFQNTVGLFKLVILVLIALTGFAALAGRTRGPRPNNFSHAFAGSRSDLYSISSCIYNAGWSYVGYSNASLAAGEIRDPVRAFKLGGPLALGIICALYVLVQTAYFAAVPKHEILEGKNIVAALFFQHTFGESSARALSCFVALSAIANVFSVIFSQGRLIQALGREGFLPFSSVLASNRPLNAPLAGMAWHVLVTLIILLAPPPGDAYNLVLNLSSYPFNIVNVAVAAGLFTSYLPLRFRPEWARHWEPPIRAGGIVTLFFTLVSLFLVVVPWIPPVRPDDSVYVKTWYALAPALSMGIFAGGALYWLLWAKLLPRWYGYELVPSQETLSDGTKVQVFNKVPVK